jgi:hypothetical protein
MKIALLIGLLFTTSAFARQMFQCSTFDTNSSDVMHINLATPTNGTLFLSSGMQNPETERILVKIAFSKIEGAYHVFKVIEQPAEGFLAIPSQAIGKASNSVNLELKFGYSAVTFSCFSRIYHE